MKRSVRLAQWAGIATSILLFFWLAATVGGWSPDIRKLTSSVHGLQVADYRAESPQLLAPLSAAITKDASQDQAAAAGHSSPTPRPSQSGGPSPSASGSGPTPSGSATLPVATPTLPLATPTLPVATPTVPVATPTPPTLNLPPTPTAPTPPVLF
jgi:hypothetical protein